MNGTTAVRETKTYVTYENGKISGAIYITANQDTNATWGASYVCTRKDVLFVDNLSTEIRDHDCMIVNYTVRTAAVATGVFALVDAASITHGGLPQTWLVAEYDINGRTPYDNIFVSVRRNVAIDGFNEPVTSWNASAWNKTSISPDRKAVVQRFLDWAKAYHAVLQRDFKG